MPDQLRISAVRVDENNPTVYFVPLDIAVGERDEARAERDRLREEGLRAIAAIDEAISHYNISEAKRIARAMYDRWRVSP
jgi:hypothetical protein